jgi:hypothetical protein
VGSRAAGAYDWSKVDWITVRRGRSERYAFRGVCKPLSKGRGYRINCDVSRHTPYQITYSMRVSPLYRDPDGTWLKVSQGRKVGDRYVAARKGKRVQWRRLYRHLELRSEDEVLVFLVAHEAFHYLRKTRQVEGRHGEIEADAFALKTLEQYREWSSTWPRDIHEDREDHRHRPPRGPRAAGGGDERDPLRRTGGLLPKSFYLEGGSFGPPVPNT